MRCWRSGGRDRSAGIRSGVIEAADYDVEEEPERRVLIRTIEASTEPAPDRWEGFRAMTVRKLEVADATESLAAYIRKAAGSGPVVITDEGQPIAALVMLEGTDLDSVALSTDPEFLALI